MFFNLTNGSLLILGSLIKKLRKVTGSSATLACLQANKGSLFHSQEANIIVGVIFQKHRSKIENLKTELLENEWIARNKKKHFLKLSSKMWMFLHLIVFHFLNHVHSFRLDHLPV